MTALIMTVIATVTFLAGIILGVLIFEKRMLYLAKGSIVMYGDELYLSLTTEDTEAFKTAEFATLRLQREKFNGFSGT